MSSDATSQTGTVTLDIPTNTTRRAVEREQDFSASLERQFREGGLTLDRVSTAFHCTSDDLNITRLSRIDAVHMIFMRNGQEVRCEAFSFNELQEIACEESGGGPEACFLTLTPQP
ncbi:MAG: hypothetical protein AAFX99_07285 [Myxococcota bacterium]